jgi:hypothetical protein
MHFTAFPSNADVTSQPEYYFFLDTSNINNVGAEFGCSHCGALMAEKKLKRPLFWSDLNRILN